MRLKTWTLCLILFATALGGLPKAKADEDGDYWRYRQHRWHDGYRDREDWRYRRRRWREREVRRDYWRRQRHYDRRDEGVVIRLP